METSADPRLALLLVVLTGLALTVLGRVGFRLQERGGRVGTADLTLPDLLVCIVLAGSFVLLIVQSFTGPAKPPLPLKIDQVLPGSFLLVLISAGVGAFLKMRGIRLRTALGFDRLSVWRAAGRALILFCAALPVVWITNVVAVSLMPQAGSEQELVKLFKTEAQGGRFNGIAQILFAGVILAPAAEEFLFRGYFYGVFKRYLGPGVSALFTAGLFAAFHMNLGALPGLFVLALCFTLAYEATGSLLVPIAMHALFNFTNLGVLFLQAQGRIP